MRTALIPARGTVEFHVYLLGDDPDILIDGPDRWSRPVVGLVERDWDTYCRDLPYEPVVVASSVPALTTRHCQGHTSATPTYAEPTLLAPTSPTPTSWMLAMMATPSGLTELSRSSCNSTLP
jgi:hypothetical protein